MKKKKKKRFQSLLLPKKPVGLADDADKNPEMVEQPDHQGVMGKQSVQGKSTIEQSDQMVVGSDSQGSVADLPNQNLQASEASLNVGSGSDNSVPEGAVSESFSDAVAVVASVCAVVKGAEVKAVEVLVTDGSDSQAVSGKSVALEENSGQGTSVSSGKENKDSSSSGEAEGPFILVTGRKRGRKAKRD